MGVSMPEVTPKSAEIAREHMRRRETENNKKAHEFMGL